MKMTAERNYGVDLAKAIAIFLVVLTHVLQGGVDYPTSGAGLWTHAYVKGFASCCVNLFALVSGYVGVTGHPSLRKYFRLWLQVVVTGGIVTAFTRFVLGVPLEGIDYTHIVLPVTSAAYWYFTAYTGVYCFMPLLNAGLKALDRRSALGVAAALFAVLSVSASVGARDVYGHVSGYSVIWLLVLYVFGGLVRLHLPRLPRLRWCVLAAALLPTLTMAQDVLCASRPALAAKLSGRCLAGHYISPVVTLTALALFLACLQYRAVSDRVRRTVVFLSSVSFGIYLFHNQSTLFHRYWKPHLEPLGRLCGENLALWLACSFGLAVAVYVVCALLEKGRQAVMRRLGV